jgi:hypothetical protein
MANPFLYGSPFYYHVYNKVHVKRENCLIVTTGKVQKGKSTVNCISGYNLDPRFTGDTAFFTPDKFSYSIATKFFKRGRFILFEEVGTESGGMNRRKWYDFNNFVVNDVFQTFGYEGLIVAFSVPSLKYIDKNSLILMDYKIEVLDKNLKEKTNRAKIFELEYNETYDKLYRHYLKNHLGEKVTEYHFKLPNTERFKEIYGTFKSREKEFKKKIQKEGARKLREAFTTKRENIEEIVDKLVNDFLYDKKYWEWYANQKKYCIIKALFKRDFDRRVTIFTECRDLTEYKLKELGVDLKKNITQKT